jgi:hypothetical protein
MFTLGSTVYDYLLDQTGIVIANPDDATKIRVQFVNPETNKVFTQFYTLDGKQAATHRNQILFYSSVEISPIEHRWKWICQQISTGQLYISVNWYSDATVDDLKVMSNDTKFVEKIEDTRKTFRLDERV